MSAEKRSRSQDRELTRLLDLGKQALSQEGFQGFLKAHERFNKPVSFLGRRKTDKNYYLKDVLKPIPEYIESSSRIGLNSQQAESLLIHTLNSARNEDFEAGHNSQNIMLLSRIFRSMEEKQHTLSKSEYESLRSFITRAGESDALKESLYAFSIGQELNLEMEKSISLIDSLSKIDGTLNGYTFGHFLDALNVFKGSGTDPNLVVDAFLVIGGKRPYFHRAEYDFFADMITFFCPSKKISPTELLRIFLSERHEEEKFHEFMQRRFVDIDTISQPNLTTIEVGENPNAYFYEKQGTLDYMALPYRINRSFEEGLTDLEAMTKRSILDVKPIAQGAFIFDPQSDTWYSLGGKTEITPTGARHSFVNYDISTLSSHPVFVSTHPTAFDSALFQRGEEGTLEEKYARVIMSVATALPSTQDYLTCSTLSKKQEIFPEAIIINSHGITQFRFPHDREAVEQFAQAFKKMKDEAIMDALTRIDPHIPEGYMIKEEVAVPVILQHINQFLPEGFGISLFPSLEEYLKTKQTENL